jgi:hypothetical protein
MSTDGRSRSLALRTALVSGVALACLVGWTESGGARAHKTREAAAAKKPADDPLSKARGVLQIVVSIGSQHATLYNDGTRVAVAAVSTGIPGHPTPMGVFSIIQKDRYHHSNIYSGAPMPYMQRITWSGVAIHEGVVPGHPASHGCIRTTHAFASSLWPITKLGVRVIVSRNDPTPVDFSHPSLFSPKPKPPDGAVAMLDQKPARLIQVAESTGSSSDTSDVGAPSAAPDKPAPADVDPPKPAAPTGKRVEQPPKRRGQVSMFVSRKEQKVFVRQGFIPLLEMPVTIEDNDRPLGTHLFTALGADADGSGMRWNLFTVASADTKKVVEKQRSRGRTREVVRTVVVEGKPSSSAAEALDRIKLPKEAVDLMSELLAPGASLLVSDLPRSGETGTGTDFVVLTR